MPGGLAAAAIPVAMCGSGAGEWWPPLASGRGAERFLLPGRLCAPAASDGCDASAFTADASTALFSLRRHGHAKSGNMLASAFLCEVPQLAARRHAAAKAAATLAATSLSLAGASAAIVSGDAGAHVATASAMRGTARSVGRRTITAYLSALLDPGRKMFNPRPYDIYDEIELPSVDMSFPELANFVPKMVAVLAGFVKFIKLMVKFLVVFAKLMWKLMKYLAKQLVKAVKAFLRAAKEAAKLMKKAAKALAKAAKKAARMAKLIAIETKKAMIKAAIAAKLLAIKLAKAAKELAKKAKEAIKEALKRLAMAAALIKWFMDTLKKMKIPKPPGIPRFRVPGSTAGYTSPWDIMIIPLIKAQATAAAVGAGAKSVAGSAAGAAQDAASDAASGAASAVTSMTEVASSSAGTPEIAAASILAELRSQAAAGAGVHSRTPLATKAARMSRSRGDACKPDAAHARRRRAFHVAAGSAFLGDVSRVSKTQPSV
eukprot:TRINITY_DN26194_c0_g1_i1.p1 TRINITY_DN26194_c0_g1~~TRINITY_DN26194_c0_g1_i1.p1  ORF type:complete len:514 (-),score=148.05 TRINITY_DN26194_c0_g1_i1:20-1483(-)